MSDRRLREIERDAAQGDPEAQLALLRERIRAGVVDGQRVRFRAFLGDETCRVALDLKGSNSWKQRAIRKWAYEVLSRGEELGLDEKQIVCRMVLAASEAVLQREQEDHDRFHGPDGERCVMHSLGNIQIDGQPHPFEGCLWQGRVRGIRQAVAAMKLWVDSPSEANRQALGTLNAVLTGEEAGQGRGTIGAALQAFASRNPGGYVSPGIKAICEADTRTGTGIRNVVSEALLEWVTL